MEGQAEAASEGDPDTRRGTPAVATAPAPPRTAAAPVDVLPLDDGPEEDFLDQLIASERVAVWLSTIRAEAGKAQTSARLKISVSELAAACQAEAYAEEARLAGAVQLLTTLLKRSEDEELLGSISDALSACSGIMAASRTASTFTYGSTPVMIREGSLGDGVGARMWTVAHAFCRELASKPGILVGKTVLEIGSGCGACGILAAKLGAQVTLTDYVDSVLHNLRYCMHLNSTSSSGSSSAEPKAPATAWDAPPSMCARFYDWNDSMGCLSEAERAALAAIPGLAKGLAAAGAPGGIIDTGSNHNDVPALDDAARFEVVLGTDVLYEWPMVMMLPAVLKHRLKAPGGKAMLCCAVREQAMFEAFILALNTVGMNVDTAVIEPLKVDSDLLKVRQSYEGGFKVVIVSLPQVVN